MTLKQWAELNGLNYGTVRVQKNKGRIVADGDGFRRVDSTINSDVNPGALTSADSGVLSVQITQRAERVAELEALLQGATGDLAVEQAEHNLTRMTVALQKARIAELEAELADCQAAKLVTPEYHETAINQVPTKRSSVLGSSVRDSSIVLDTDERFTVDSDMPQFYRR